jgi:hypothetical protein
MRLMARHLAQHRRDRRFALARYVARTTAWGPVLAGCLAGIGLAVALLIFAGPIETPAVLAAGLRASFLPVVAGLAFLLPDPQRWLIGALPARSWLLSAVRLGLAAPVAGLSCAVQLSLAARALGIDERSGSQPGGQAGALPWLALAGELAAWCVLALALSAAFGRGRWQDQAGIAAACVALATVGVAAALPLHLLPATITGMTSAQRGQWRAAWWLWAGVAGVAAVAGCWAAGDSWRRLRCDTGHISSRLRARN